MPAYTDYPKKGVKQTNEGEYTAPAISGEVKEKLTVNIVRLWTVQVRVLRALRGSCTPTQVAETADTMSLAHCETMTPSSTYTRIP